MSRSAETTMSYKGPRAGAPRPQVVRDHVDLVMADQALSSLRASGHEGQRDGTLQRSAHLLELAPEEHGAGMGQELRGGVTSIRVNGHA